MKYNKRLFFALLCAALIISASGGCSLFGGNNDSGNKEEASVSGSSVQSSSDESNKNIPESSNTESSASESSKKSVSSESEISSKTESSQPETSRDVSSESKADDSSAAESSTTQQSNVERSYVPQEISEEEASDDETGFVDFSSENEDLSLRDLYESSKYNDVIEDTKKQYESDDYDIDVSLEGENTVIVTAKSKKQVDPASLDKATLESYFDTIGKNAGSYIALLEGTTTTKNIVIRARLVNANGSIISARNYSRKNTQASAADTDSDNGPVGHDLKSIVGSPLVQKLISEAASSTGDSGAQASADVDGNNVIISITLSRAVPDGAEQAAAAQSGDISSYTDDLRKQLANLSSDENVTVTVRVFDTTGKQIV